MSGALPDVGQGGRAAGAAGTGGAAEAVRAEVTRLPPELTARLAGAERALTVTGTAGRAAPDGTVPVRTAFGEVSVRPGGAVPADRPVSIVIAPQPGLTEAGLARRPLPATVLVPKDATHRPGPPRVAEPSVTVRLSLPLPTAGARPVAGPRPVPGPPGAAAQAGPPPGASAAASAAQAGTAAGPGGVAAPAQGGQAGTPAVGQPVLPVSAAGAPVPGGAPGAPVPGGPALPTVAPGADGARPLPGTAGPQSTGGPQGIAPGAGPGTGSAAGRSGPGVGAPAGGAIPAADAGTALLRTAPPPAATGHGAPADRVAPLPGARPAAAGTGIASDTGSGTASRGGPAGAAARAGVPGAPSLSAPAALTLGASGPLTAGAGRAAYPLLPLAPLGGGAGPGAAPGAFPALHEALAALMHIQPALARQVRGQIPQPNAMMGATMLFFLSALRGGDMRAWLGERTARVLEAAGRGDAVGRLAGEFAQLSRQPAEAPAGDWRLYTIPVYGDGDLRPVQLAVRREPGGDDPGEAGEEPGRRFLIDLTMSRIGAMQLDGLYKAQRLGLVVRTQRLLPAWMRTEIGEVFANACDAAGLHRTLAFQSGAHAWVRPGAASGVRPGDG